QLNLFLHSFRAPPAPHSFPTRRSSDLRHPDFENVWLAGGGSGHGFKHGPFVGEYIAARIVARTDPEPRFSLTAKKIRRRRTVYRSEEHTSELQSRFDLVCRLLLEKKKM